MCPSVDLLVSVCPVSPAPPHEPPQTPVHRLTAVLTTAEVKLRRGVKLLQPVRGETALVAVLDDLVGVHDDRDEEGEHHVDEEADEYIQVDPAAGENNQY